MSGEKRVLVTGFEPFGQSKLNPSQLLVEALTSEDLPGVELSALVLPVEFDRASEILLTKIAQISPDFVISFGQAEGRSAITPEKIAINLNHARIADNSGDQRQDSVIDELGNDGYFSTLPVNQIVEAIKSVGVESELSLSAGTFVCNHIFYKLQKELSNSSIKSGFIHIPLVPEQSAEFPGAPTMEINLIIRGAKAAILSIL